MLKLSFLGPLKVEQTGEPAGHFVSTKALALLCYLAMRDGPQAREHLAGLLWGEMPEERAKANLRMALYNLQKLLPGSLIVTRLTVTFNRDQPYRLDVEAFNSGLNTSEEQFASLRSALNLYRGEFLEGLYINTAPEFEMWLLEQREHLRLIFSRALEKLANHYMARADWAASIEVFHRLLAIDTLQEDVHQRLMLALARNGQFEAALAQYQNCCRALKKELGVEPSPETTALFERIQVLRLQPHNHNLTVRHDRIIGRESELNNIANLLRNPACRLITLIGPGGIGKSRLALQAAANAAHEGLFFEGIYLVQLASVYTPDLLASGIAEAIQLALQGPAEPKEQLIKCLRDKEVLLVLDNFEHLIEGGKQLLTAILANAPEVKLMLTSRERLNIQQEWLLEVEGLQFPKPSTDPVQGEKIVWERAETYPAVQLFVERAQHVQSKFPLSDTDAPAVIRICQLVEGMPLGIELAASWVRSVSCQRIVEEIEHNLGFLSSPQHEMSERHHSMLAVFEHSWRSLSTEERNVFKRLSVFRGGFRREAAEEVAGASLPILSSLVDKSFLHRNSSGRFEVHELMRQYAEKRLGVVPQELEEARNLHSSYFVLFLHDRENQLKGGKQVTALQEINTEIDNIRTAWRWAVDRRRAEEVGKAIEGLWAFYELRGWYQEGEDTFGSAATRFREILAGYEFSEMGFERVILGMALSRLGWFYWHQGRYKQSGEILDQVLDLFPESALDARREKGFCFLQLGIVNLYLGRFLDSRKFFQESQVISREVGDGLTLILSLNGLCFTALALGEYAEAKLKQEESLARLRTSNDRRGIAHNLIWFGWGVRIARGEFGEAEQLVSEGMAICQEINDKFGLGLALNHFGVLSYLREDYPNAAQLHRQSRDVFQEIGDQWGMAYALNGLGNAEFALGEPKSADQDFREALKISIDTGALPVAMESIVGLAMLLYAGGQNEKIRALELFEFVLNHPASEYETKGKASRLVAEIELELPAQVVTAAQNRGQAKNLEGLVEDILGNVP
ncbi:MAG: hypothetical protein FIB03_14290 [Anaerolineae bacterium]|nr:hypothetical protein [Anaerolineae bacterium]